MKKSFSPIPDNLCSSAQEVKKFVLAIKTIGRAQNDMVSPQNQVENWNHVVGPSIICAGVKSFQNEKREFVLSIQIIYERIKNPNTYRECENTVVWAKIRPKIKKKIKKKIFFQWESNSDLWDWLPRAKRSSRLILCLHIRWNCIWISIENRKWFLFS